MISLNLQERIQRDARTMVGCDSGEFFFILMFFEFMNEIDILGDRFLFFKVKLGVKTMRATIKRGFCQVLIGPLRGNYRRNLNFNVTTKFCENIDTIKAISREAGSCFSIISRLC